MVDSISAASSITVTRDIGANNKLGGGEESKEVVSTKAEETREGGAIVTAAPASAEESGEANDNPSEEKSESGNLGRSVNIQA